MRSGCDTMTLVTGTENAVGGNAPRSVAADGEVSIRQAAAFPARPLIG